MSSQFQWENFNYSGCTDVTRFILAVSGHFSVNRDLRLFDEWINDIELKVDFVFSQVPFSDFTDSDRINLPYSIARYYARIHNLAGSDSLKEMVRHLKSFNVFVRH